MFSSYHLTTSCLLLLATVLVAQQTVCDKLELNHVSNSTTAPKSAPAIFEVKPSPTAVHNPPSSNHSQISVTTSSPNVKIDTKVHTVVTVVPSSAPTVHAPSLASTPAARLATNTVVANSTPTNAPASNQTPGQRLALYFEPICNHLDKLLPEHIFKIQSQMKQFVEKTAGKMSVCFMQHFMIDPNLKPVDKTQLVAICSSEKLAAGVKGSFSSFQACAQHNWDKNLDQELERIIRLRLNCFFNHSHSKNDSTVSLVHDNDDISLIGEVVGKVLNNNNSKGESIGKANITMIDVGPAPSPSKAPATVVTTSSHANKTVAPHTTPAAHSQSTSSRNILNDPNTLLVFVDDSRQTTKAPVKVTTPTPVALHNISIAPVKTIAGPATNVSITTLKPTPKVVITTSAPHLASKNGTHSPVDVKIVPISTTSAKPATTVLGEKILSAVSTSAPASPLKIKTAQPATSSKPTVIVLASTVKPTKPPVIATTSSPLASKNHLLTVVISTTNAPVKVSKSITNASTTIKPSSAPVMVVSVKPLTTTTKPQATPTKAASAKPSTTGKPVVVIENVSKKPDSDKHDSDSKIKDEHEKKMKQLKKDQDENDAKNAIKALQKQRDGHVSDARMHQIEHERQMTIDPVGHTLKHQRYEQMKQQRESTQAPPSSKKS